LPRNDEAAWVIVARVANLAEAGFLVDELSGEGVSARIYQSEDFNALTDRWSVSYLINRPQPRRMPWQPANSTASGRRRCRPWRSCESPAVDANLQLADPMFWPRWRRHLGRHGKASPWGSVLATNEVSRDSRLATRWPAR
jgi:hypothetical protein